MSGRHPASFRDPSGFVFTRGSTLYRQVNEQYRPTYDAAVSSGLFAKLHDNGLLVDHRVADDVPVASDEGSLVLEPEPVPFVSHPYEWCPGQLREAALATLDIQLVAMDHGFVLKDASAFNIQFLDGRPVLIDTLSFDLYEEGRPWVAYGQFCRHFLAPLALARLVDPSLLRSGQVHLDGIPLDVAARVLPRSSRYSWGLGVHVHAHASAQRRHADRQVGGDSRRVSASAVRGLVESLRAVVRKQKWEPPKTAWSDYYALRESYTESAIDEKQDLVRASLTSAQQLAEVRTVWDLGANTGMFSRLAAELTGADVVALEMDVAAVEIHWRNRHPRVLPLVNDLSNPSADVGWTSTERASLMSRGPADLTMALALIHHLAIGNNVPLPAVAAFLASTTRVFALLEWVPKSDPMVQRLLSSRRDVFPDYEEGALRRALDQHFTIVREDRISGSQRTLFLLESHAP